MKLTKFLHQHRKYFANLLNDAKHVEKFETYSKFTPSPISISHFLEFGRTKTSESSYMFLRKEIPVRLANIMKELELLPPELHAQTPCAHIQDFYKQSFMDMLAFEKASNDSATQDAFTSTLTAIRSRHADTVPMMADAVMLMKEYIDNNGKYSLADESQIDAMTQYFLDRLYMSRISIHMLINQHTMIYGDDLFHGSRVGCIDPHCDVKKVVEDAFNSASFLCEQIYSASPKLDLKLRNTCDAGLDELVQFVYVPAHLYHILFELFKNALRATMETHEDALEYPNLEVLVVKSEQDITIKISDQGGGIPRFDTANLFNYMYSTAPRPSMTTGQSVMAGLGYGLPLSRLYARYFHGDIVLSSVDGYGTDALVYLRALEQDASELLPVFNSNTRHLYEQPRKPSLDWTDPSANLSGYFGRPRNYYSGSAASGSNSTGANSSENKNA